MKNRNEAFGRLLKAGIASIANCEGKTAAVVEEDLGTAIGVAADTIQRYSSSDNVSARPLCAGNWRSPPSGNP